MASTSQDAIAGGWKRGIAGWWERRVGRRGIRGPTAEGTRKLHGGVRPRNPRRKERPGRDRPSRGQCTASSRRQLSCVIRGHSPTRALFALTGCSEDAEAPRRRAHAHADFRQHQGAGQVIRQRRQERLPQLQAPGYMTV